MDSRKDHGSSLLPSGFLAEVDKVSIFGVKIIRLIIGAVLLLCFLILSYVIWSDSLQLNDIEMENDRIRNSLDKIIYGNIDMKHHMKQITEEINIVEGEYKQIEGKTTLKSFAFIHSDKAEQLLNEAAEGQISEWIGRNKHFHFKLIYKATRDGDTAEVYHEKVDAFKPTISLFKTTDAFFGAYTAESWKGDDGFVKDDNAFLFSLSKQRKYTINYSWNSIYRRSSSLSFFGNQDLIIRDNCLRPSMDHYSNFPNSYGINCDKLELTNGHSTFTLTEMEVYHVISNE